MGLAIDSSVFITCERKTWNALRVATHLANLFPNDPVIIPSVVAAELLQGLYRAKTPTQFADRQTYVQAILSSYPIAPFTEATARIAGEMRGKQAAQGNTLPLADSFIAATALELNYAVVTANTRDFNRIPNLQVIPFTI